MTFGPKLKKKSATLYRVTNSHMTLSLSKKKQAESTAIKIVKATNPMIYNRSYVVRNLDEFSHLDGEATPAVDEKNREKISRQ